MDEQVLVDDVCTVQLRANDFDWSGHLNNAVYFQLFEQGRWSWIERNGINLKHSGLVGVVSNLEVSYRKAIVWQPLRGVRVGTSLRELAAYSITLRQAVYDDDEEPAASATLRLGLLDLTRNRLARIDMEVLKHGVQYLL